MERTRNVNTVVGLLMILLGTLFLAIQFVPGFGRLFRVDLFWPLIIVAIGAVFMVFAVATHEPDLAIPGAIVGGIGLLLLYQNLTGHWDSWAYAWTLIPSFVGVGLIISGLLGKDKKETLQGGLILLLISGIMFLFFGAFLGPLAILWRLWPVVLIGVGLLLLGRALIRR